MLGKSYPTWYNKDRSIRRMIEDEVVKLDRLRQATDRFVLRRSYALAILKWRGHTIAQETPNI